MIWFSWYLQPETDGYDSDKNVEFSGGNVHLITTKESWDQKMAEASRDGKIVSIPSPSPPSFPPPYMRGLAGIVNHVECIWSLIVFLSCLFSELLLIFSHEMYIIIFVNVVMITWLRTEVLL